MDWHHLTIEYLTTLRTCLFLSCASYWVIMVGWLKPDPDALRRGALAALMQFWFGLAFDAFAVRLGFWTFRAMPFSIGGVPIDLHLDWTLLWGFGLVWLSDRWPGRKMSGSAFCLYILSWTGLTLLFDIAMRHWMIFLDSVSPAWWVGDIVFLTSAQATTLWLYRSMGHADEPTCGLGRLPPMPPYLRSILYLSFFLGFFFYFLPLRVEAAAARLGFVVHPKSVPLVPGILTFLALAFGGWSTHEFARRGRGTPVPWDPPRYLVDTGPYAFVANPMQLSGCLLTLAVFAWRPSWVMFAYLLDVILVVESIFALMEPEGLMQRFGDTYRRYTRRVPRWRIRLLPRAREHSREPILFFDSACGLCSRMIEALLELDVTRCLRVSPLSGKKAESLIPRMKDADTIVLYEPGMDDTMPALVSLRSRASLRALATGPLPAALFSAFEGIPGLPQILDIGYRAIARRRLCVPRSAGDSLSFRSDSRFIS